MPPRDRRKSNVHKIRTAATKLKQTSMENIADDGVHVQSDYLAAKAGCSTSLSSAHSSEAQSTTQHVGKVIPARKIPIESENQCIKTNPPCPQNVSKIKYNTRNSSNSKTRPKMSSQIIETCKKVQARTNDGNKRSEITDDHSIIHHAQSYPQSIKAHCSTSLTSARASKTQYTSEHVCGKNHGDRKCKSDFQTSLKLSEQSLNLQDRFSNSSEHFSTSYEISEFDESGCLQTTFFKVDKNYFKAKPSVTVNKHEGKKGYGIDAQSCSPSTKAACNTSLPSAPASKTLYTSEHVCEKNHSDRKCKSDFQPSLRKSGSLQTTSFKVDENYFEGEHSSTVSKRDKKAYSILSFQKDKSSKKSSSLVKCSNCKSKHYQWNMDIHLNYYCPNRSALNCSQDKINHHSTIKNIAAADTAASYSETSKNESDIYRSSCSLNNISPELQKSPVKIFQSDPLTPKKTDFDCSLESVSPAETSDECCRSCSSKGMISDSPESMANSKKSNLHSQEQKTSTNVIAWLENEKFEIDQKQKLKFPVNSKYNSSLSFDSEKCLPFSDDNSSSIKVNSNSINSQQSCHVLYDKVTKSSSINSELEKETCNSNTLETENADANKETKSSAAIRVTDNSDANGVTKKYGSNVVIKRCDVSKVSKNLDASRGTVKVQEQTAFRKSLPRMQNMLAGSTSVRSSIPSHKVIKGPGDRPSHKNLNAKNTDLDVSNGNSANILRNALPTLRASDNFDADRTQVCIKAKSKDTNLNTNINNAKVSKRVIPRLLVTGNSNGDSDKVCIKSIATNCDDSNISNSTVSRRTHPISLVTDNSDADRASFQKVGPKTVSINKSDGRNAKTVERTIPNSVYVITSIRDTGIKLSKKSVESISDNFDDSAKVLKKDVHESFTPYNTNTESFKRSTSKSSESSSLINNHPRSLTLRKDHLASLTKKENLSPLTRKSLPKKIAKKLFSNDRNETNH